MPILINQTGIVSIKVGGPIKPSPAEEVSV